MHFESCSGPAAAIVRYEWRMLGPPVPASPPDAPSFDFDFTGDPRCVGASPFNRPVRLTVFDAGSTSEELQEDVSVVPTPTSRIPDETISMRSRLMVTAEAGEITGMLSVDGRSLGPPVGGIATVHQLPMRPGEQRIVGQVLGRAPPGTLWRFDFPRPVRVVVRQGATLSLTDRTVVFRLEGRSGERIEFGLRLEGGAPRP